MKHNEGIRRRRWPASSTQQLIDLTAQELRSGAETAARPVPPAMIVGWQLRLVGVVVDDVDLPAVIDLDRHLHLTLDGKDPKLVTDLLLTTGRTSGRIGGHSRTSLARRLLDGLPEMLTRPCDSDGDPRHHQLDREEWLTINVAGLRLAQLAIWLCERDRGNPEAHELLPRSIEAAFLLASLPLRLLRPVSDTSTGDGPTIGLQRAGLSPIDDQARTIWQRHLCRPDGDVFSLQRRRNDLQASRTRWLELLGSAERYPSLAGGGPKLMERRLAVAVRRDPAIPTPSDLGRARRALHVFQADEPLLTTPPVRGPSNAYSDGSTRRQPDPQPTIVQDSFRVEREQLLDLASGHLLPRYLIDLTLGLLLALRDEHVRRSSHPALQRVWWLASRTLLPLTATVGLIAVLTAMTAPVLVGLSVGSPQRAVAQSLQLGLLAAAGVWLSVIVAVVVLGGREGSYLALLRMPATTAFGLAILLSFAGDWLRPPAGWATAAVPLVLITLAFGYLFIETVNQGAEGPQAVGRAVLLGLIGTGVAVVVTAGVTFALTPAFFGSTDAYQLIAASPARFLWAVLLASSAAFALGTFLQAIWDEAPVTAPLSRLRLR
jgi:hypothetical protein